MGGVHDGGVSAFPPHRRHALSGPQREGLLFWTSGPSARARVGARQKAHKAIILSVFRGAPARLQRQLGELNPAQLGSLHHVRCTGDSWRPRGLGRR